MADTTNIQWTDTTWSCITGCSRHSPGCSNCYAERLTATRLKGQAKYQGLAVLTPAGEPHWTGDIRLHPGELAAPLRWRKPRVVFVNSMSDTFHEDVPDSFLDLLFAVMGLCQEHTFQVLTKRADRMRAYLTAPGVEDRVYEAMEHFAEDHDIADFLFDAWPLPNVWAMASVENQLWADRRVPELLKVPARVRGLSVEPLLGPVELVKGRGWPYGISGFLTRTNDGGPHDRHIDWVIVGGESGGGARICFVEWVRALVRQCRDAGVAVFVKQLGACVADDGATAAHSFPEDQCWPDGTRTDGRRVLLRDPKGGDPAEWPADLRVREFPT